jgi:hypothetical protein
VRRDQRRARQRGTQQLFRNFPNAEFGTTWYPGALANKQAGSTWTWR